MDTLRQVALIVCAIVAIGGSSAVLPPVVEELSDYQEGGRWDLSNRDTEQVVVGLAAVVPAAVCILAILGRPRFRQRRAAGYVAGGALVVFGLWAFLQSGLGFVIGVVSVAAGTCALAAIARQPPDDSDSAGASS